MYAHIERKAAARSCTSAMYCMTLGRRSSRRARRGPRRGTAQDEAFRRERRDLHAHLPGNPRIGAPARRHQASPRVGQLWHRGCAGHHLIFTRSHVLQMRRLVRSGLVGERRRGLSLPLHGSSSTGARARRRLLLRPRSIRQRHREAGPSRGADASHRAATGRRRGRGPPEPRDSRTSVAPRLRARTGGAHPRASHSGRRRKP